MKSNEAARIEKVYVWSRKDLSGDFEVSLDQENSPITRSEIYGTREIDETGGPAVFVSELTKAAFMRGADILQSDVACPMLSSLAKSELEPHLPKTNAQFYPATLSCADGNLSGQFYCLRALERITCIDIDRSDVDWINASNSFYHWRRLVSLACCLPGFAVARDKHSPLFLISQDVFMVLRKFRNAERFFVPPERYSLL